jgi:hypothetical protein
MGKPRNIATQASTFRGFAMPTLAPPADKRGAVITLCEWYALHAVDSNYELYCDDNEMRVGTKASMIEWLYDIWSPFA